PVLPVLLSLLRLRLPVLGLGLGRRLVGRWLGPRLGLGPWRLWPRRLGPRRLGWRTRRLGWRTRRLGRRTRRLGRRTRRLGRRTRRSPLIEALSRGWTGGARGATQQRPVGRDDPGAAEPLPGQGSRQLRSRGRAPCHHRHRPAERLRPDLDG